MEPQKLNEDVSFLNWFPAELQKELDKMTAELKDQIQEAEESLSNATLSKCIFEPHLRNGRSTEGAGVVRMHI